MTATAFIGIQAALLAALQTAPAVAEGRIYTNRRRAVGAAYTTAVVVLMDQANASKEVLMALDWVTTYSVECYARAVSGADPAAAVDTLLADAWARLAAIDPADMGVSEIAVLPAVDWQYDDADTPTVCAILRLQIRHRTPHTALSPWI